MVAFGVERAWRDLPCFPAVGDEFSAAIGALDPDKRGDTPALMVRRKKDGKVRLHWMGETTRAMADHGEDPRGAVDPPPFGAGACRRRAGAREPSDPSLPRGEARAEIEAARDGSDFVAGNLDVDCSANQADVTGIRAAPGSRPPRR